METFRSGTTTERIVRTLILTVVLVLYSAWCFRDGYYKWPLGNLPKLLETLPVPPPPEFELINPAVTRGAFEVVARGATTSEVEARLGEPSVRERETAYYIGRGGMARINFYNDKVTTKQWVDGLKTDSDLFLQKIIGVITGALGLLMVLQLIRVLITRVELTEAGLRVNSQGGLRFGGSPLVPLDAMVGLRTDDYDRKGWVGVEYKLADGREGTVGLNDYVHKAFPEIVPALCEHHGWEDPIKKRQEARAAEAAAQQDGRDAPEATPETAPGDQPDE